MKNLCILLTFILLPGVSIAQDTIRIAPVQEQNIPNTQQDTIQHTPLFNFYWGVIKAIENGIIPLSITPLNADYYRLFMPLTVYNSAFDWRDKRVEILKSTDEIKSYDPFVAKMEEFFPVDTLLFTRVDRARRTTNEFLLDIYIKNLDYKVYYEDQIMSHQLLQDVLPQKEPSKDPIMRLFTPDKPSDKVADAEIIIRKPNFWVTGGSGSLQLSQNEISDNWYQGGESMNSLTSELKLFANYNDKEKVQFENLVEIKIGFNSVSSDTIRKYRVNTDLFRFYSKLGIQAASSWYYTVTGELKTQLFNNYKANSKDVVSAFLAPANLNLSIGMDYKLKKNKINLSVVMSPLAYNLRYVGDSRVDETKFGLDEGDKLLHDFGSKFQTNISWTIIPSIKYDSRIYYFTSYKKVEAEWENTINFVLNRYLSTKLFVHVRYDDGVARKDDNSFFQLKQFLSFGINYNW